MPPANNYYLALKGQAERVNLPKQLKCTRCTRFLNHDNFAANRILDLRMEILKEESGSGTRTKINPKMNPAVKPYIACKNCVGAPPTELECTMCDQTMLLEKFSKAQRKSADSAVCYNCMEARQNVLPRGNSSDDDNDGGSGSDYDSDYSEYGTTAMGTGLSTLSIGNTAGGASLQGGTSIAGGGVAIGESPYQSGVASSASQISRPTSTTNSQSGRGTVPSSVTSEGTSQNKAAQQQRGRVIGNGPPKHQQTRAARPQSTESTDDDDSD